MDSSIKVIKETLNKLLNALKAMVSQLAQIVINVEATHYALVVIL